MNKNNYDDMMLLNYLESLPIEMGSLNSYIKKLIKKDMKEHEKD